MCDLCESSRGRDEDRYTNTEADAARFEALVGPDHDPDPPPTLAELLREERG